MSYFKNAPLIEVIFELRWSLDGPDAFNKSQFLFGDLYANLSKDYPYRETIVDSGIPLPVLASQPVHRYRKDNNGYPLIQVGPGIITLNTNGQSYLWESFIKKSEVLVNNFFDLHPIEGTSMVGPSLVYLDFFKFDFQNGNIYEFVDKFFNIDFRQNFLSTKQNPNNININFSYETEMGQLLVAFVRGKNSDGENGLLIQTRLNSQGVPATTKDVITWLNKAHRFSVDLFNELTKGELLKSFQ